MLINEPTITSINESGVEKLAIVKFFKLGFNRAFYSKHYTPSELVTFGQSQWVE